MWAGRVLHAALSGGPRGRRAQSALAQLRGILEEELEGIRGAGTWKSERVITSRQGPRIHVDGVSGEHPQGSRSKDSPIPSAGGRHPLSQLF
uniref:Glycine C-acetyltransferase n=1 Tax=Equus caballus TaxID=9796 RepID=A0A5F5PYA9_HORSE